jgi:hypothetical protein
MADPTPEEIASLVARLQSDHERLADLTENIDFPAFYLEAASDYGDNAGEAAAALCAQSATIADLTRERDELTNIVDSVQFTNERLNELNGKLFRERNTARETLAQIAFHSDAIRAEALREAEEIALRYQGMAQATASAFRMTTGMSDEYLIGKAVAAKAIADEIAALDAKTAPVTPRSPRRTA